MTSPLRQKLNKSSYSSSPNRFQILAPSSPSPALRPSSSYLQILGSTPKSPSSQLSTQDFPTFASNKNQTQSTPTSSSQAPKKTQYFSKFKKEPIIILEPEYHNPMNRIPNFQEISKKVFLDNFYFIPDDLIKNRKYYEYILIDTSSVEIEHNYDANETSKISYSKIKILKVLTPREFATDMYTSKSFSNPSCLLRYSYLDYKKAWFNIFFIRPFTHSWFIQFYHKLPSPLPQWFFHWWSYFGMTRDILPTPVLQGFEEYKKNYFTDSSPCLLSFAIQFSVPWILSWTFQTETIDHIQWLVREFNIKWWANFKTERADALVVHKRMASDPKQVTIAPSQFDFKTRKARLQMALANATTEEEFQKIIAELQEFNSASNTEKSDDSTETDSQDPFLQPDFYSQYQ